MLKNLCKAVKKNKVAAGVIACSLAVLVLLASKGCAKGTIKAESAEDSGQMVEEAVMLTALQAAVDRSAELAGNRALGILQANTWVSASEICTVEFGEHSFTERKNGSEEVASYAVVNVYEETGTADEDGVEIEDILWLIDCMGADGSFFFVEIHMTGTEGDWDLTVESDAFSNHAYMRVAPATGIEVLGLGDDAASLIGGDREGLALALSDWCSLFFPTATKAGFSGVATVDYGEGTVELEFTIDNAAKSVLKVTYSAVTGEFKMGRQR